MADAVVKADVVVSRADLDKVDSRAAKAALVDLLPRRLKSRRVSNRVDLDSSAEPAVLALDHRDDRAVLEDRVGLADRVASADSRVAPEAPADLVDQVG